MKSIALISLILAACCIGLVLSQGENNGGAAVAPATQSNRNSLVPQKLFDFQRFKTMFKKSYGSVVEELARQKIFFARAFRAFLSFVGYKHNKSTSFMKINPMSDWTQEEFRAIETRPSSSDEGQQQQVKVDKLDEMAADLEDIEAKLKDLVENHKDEPGYKEIVDELNKASQVNMRNRRRKRSVVTRPNDNNNRRQQMTLDNLFEEPKVEQRSEKLVNRIKSNNPHYETPELNSFGAENEKIYTMSDLLAENIKRFPGAGLIGSLLDSVTSALVGPTTPQKITVRKDLPDEVFVDQRETGCFTPVKSQGQCGSCYIFSTVALYEWEYCHETGKLVEFSEQYAIDCGGRVSMKGCHGGLEIKVSKFFATYGIELRSNYPYRMFDDVCPYDKRTPANKMGYLKVTEPKLKYIKYSELDEYIKTRPILLGFGVSDEFHHYGGGVDVGAFCDHSRGHSMLVVGSGREDGIDYWLIRNSYGPFWGLEGHYKLAKEATNCFLDKGEGMILDPKTGKVFGARNALNDGQAVKHHLAEYDDADFNSVQNWLKSRITNTNIATPAPDY